MKWNKNVLYELIITSIYSELNYIMKGNNNNNILRSLQIDDGREWNELK